MLDRMKSKNSYYLVLEYCNAGDLASFVDSKCRLTEEEGRQIILQIIEGLNHLHNIKVMHRDLKLANILLHFPDMKGKEEEINNNWLKNVKLSEHNF
jgi:serine/threonine protein kinase